MGQKQFDVIVIGAGPAGEVVAGRLADAGLSVAVAESHLVAGECSYYACMPSKALLRPGELLAEAERVPGVEQAVTGDLDADAALARRDEVVHDLDDSAQVSWLEDKGIELFRGVATLDGERRVRVGEDLLVASRAVVIATGSAANMPPIDGLDSVDPWNNRQGTTAKRVPRSMVVMGGGPVGCELAQAWSSFGCDVTLIEGGPRLLTKEEEFASAQVLEAMVERHGVTVHLETKVERVRREDGQVVAELDDGSTATGEEILVAVGRKPRTDGLGLDDSMLDDRGFAATDDRLRVSGSDWLYAIGDVTGRALLTHMGKYQAWVAAENILGRDAEAVAEAIGSPRVTFTDPQVAAAGKTLQQAKDAGIDAEAVDVDTNSSAGASFYGKGVEGTSRLVIDRERGLIVGATFVGFEVSEWIHAASIAIVGEVPLERVRHAVPPFPSRSEVWLKLLEAAGL